MKIQVAELVYHWNMSNVPYGNFFKLLIFSPIIKANSFSIYLFSDITYELTAKLSHYNSFMHNKLS